MNWFNHSSWIFSFRSCFIHLCLSLLSFWRRFPLITVICLTIFLITYSWFLALIYLFVVVDFVFHFAPLYPSYFNIKNNQDRHQQHVSGFSALFRENSLTYDRHVQHNNNICVMSIETRWKSTEACYKIVINAGRGEETNTIYQHNQQTTS